MMVLQDILLLQLILISIQGLGLHANVHHNKQGPPLAMDHSWESQHFLNGNSVLEDESNMDEFVALREKTDTMKIRNARSTDEIMSGSADICERRKDDCHPNATCTVYSMNDRYFYNCTCNVGFTGDGKRCEDIDECSLKTCSPYAQCNNTVGSFGCTCNEGFTGDGTICTDINECSTNLCSPNATCNNTIGSFKCSCNEIFYGNGIICTELRPDYSSTNVYIKPGEPAVLVCSLNETVQWKKNGMIITNNERTKIFENVLVVNSKDDNDYGDYFCELKNYKGKGITMTLIKVSEVENVDDGESKTYLVLFIVALILLVFALIAIAYLLLRRRPNSHTTIHRELTAGKNEYGQSNQMFMTEMGSGGGEEESPYSGLTEHRDEEPTYQSLRDEKDGKNEPESIYEEVDSGKQKQTTKKTDDDLYAEAK